MADNFVCFVLHDIADLYSGLIVKHLNQHLYVKSWGNMRRPLPSDCSISYHVYNVKEVETAEMKPFSDTKDHSKWCVTAGPASLI